MRSRPVVARGWRAARVPGMLVAAARPIAAVPGMAWYRPIDSTRGEVLGRGDDTTAIRGHMGLRGGEQGELGVNDPRPRPR